MCLISCTLTGLCQVLLPGHIAAPVPCQQLALGCLSKGLISAVMLFPVHC